MRAAKVRMFGWKRRGHWGNLAPALASILAGILHALRPFRTSLPVIRKLTLAVLAASIAFAPLPAASVAGAPERALYNGVAEQTSTDHGHSHDDGEAMNHSAAHKHGHDPADHSHQYAFLSGGSSQWGLPPAQRWPSALSSRPDATIGLGIERPPKRTMSP